MLLVAALLVNTACGSPAGPTAAESRLPVGTLTATIDGIPFRGTGSGFRDYSSNAANPLFIVTEDPLSFMFGFGADARIGTTSYGPASSVVATFNTKGGQPGSWAAFGSLGSGSVTITTLSAASASGHFVFTLAPLAGATTGKLITEGAFNVTLSTGPQ